MFVIVCFADKKQSDTGQWGQSCTGCLTHWQFFSVLVFGPGRRRLMQDRLPARCPEKTPNTGNFPFQTQTTQAWRFKHASAGHNVSCGHLSSEDLSA